MIPGINTQSWLSAISRGRMARLQEQSRTSNPFPEKNPFRQAWELGWFSVKMDRELDRRRGRS